MQLPCIANAWFNTCFCSVAGAWHNALYLSNHLPHHVCNTTIASHCLPASVMLGMHHSDGQFVPPSSISMFVSKHLLHPKLYAAGQQCSSCAQRVVLFQLHRRQPQLQDDTLQQCVQCMHYKPTSSADRMTWHPNCTAGTPHPLLLLTWVVTRDGWL